MSEFKNHRTEVINKFSEFVEAVVNEKRNRSVPYLLIDTSTVNIDASLAKVYCIGDPIEEAGDNKYKVCLPEHKHELDSIVKGSQIKTNDKKRRTPLKEKDTGQVKVSESLTSSIVGDGAETYYLPPAVKVRQNPGEKYSFSKDIFSAGDEPSNTYYELLAETAAWIVQEGVSEKCIVHIGDKYIGNPPTKKGLLGNYNAEASKPQLIRHTHKYQSNSGTWDGDSDPVGSSASTAVTTESTSYFIPVNADNMALDTYNTWEFVQGDIQFAKEGKVTNKDMELNSIKEVNDLYVELLFMLGIDYDEETKEDSIKECYPMLRTWQKYESHIEYKFAIWAKHILKYAKYTKVEKGALSFIGDEKRFTEIKDAKFIHLGSLQANIKQNRTAGRKFKHGCPQHWHSYESYWYNESGKGFGGSNNASKDWENSYTELTCMSCIENGYDKDGRTNMNLGVIETKMFKYNGE